MKIKSKHVISMSLRATAIAATVLAAVLLVRLPATDSVTSAYPAGNTPTPSGFQGSYFVRLPAVLNSFPPPASSSYYVTNLTYSPDSNNPMYNLGYQLGQNDYVSGATADHLVTLDFGYPVYTNTSTVGTYLPFESPKVFHSTDDIRQAVKQFAKGYFYGTQTNLTSHLRIVVGTNNCCTGVSLYVFQGHGTGWANMMTDVTASISSYASQVDAVAGSDMELDFNGPYTTTQWVSNFATGTAVTPCNQGSSGRDNGCLYNFGTAAVSADSQACVSTVITAPWHGCDVWKISWGITKSGTNVPFARPLPEIYHTAESQPPYGTDANAWSALSAYSVNASWNTPHYAAMYFAGSLTQFARCGSTCDDGHGHTYPNNTPSDGYTRLYEALNGNPLTSQPIRWSTDIGIQ